MADGVFRQNVFVIIAR